MNFHFKAHWGVAVIAVVFGFGTSGAAHGQTALVLDQNRVRSFYVAFPRLAGYSDTGFYTNDPNLPGTTVEAIDVSPTRDIIGIGKSRQLYRLQIVYNTGPFALVPVTLLIKIGSPGLNALPMPGNRFGMDADPFSSNLRIVSDLGANVESDPNTGNMQGGDPLSPGAHIISATYLNGTLYGLDPEANNLVRIGAVGGNNVPGRRFHSDPYWSSWCGF